MTSLRDLVSRDLSHHIDSDVVDDLLSTYTQLLTKHRSGDLEAALTKSGRLVEHTLRAIIFVQSGNTPNEIKSVSKSIRELENKTDLQDSLRLIIPRVLYGIYTIRSKRNAVHVNEIDPKNIDVAMAVSAAGWVIAELVRLYHSSDDAVIEKCMLALSRTTIPSIEEIDGEVLVNRQVNAQTEMLLLLAHAVSKGMTRMEIGKAAKCSSASVTNALK